MWKVIRDFADLHDNKYVYHAGDIYPRHGAELSIDAERYTELSTNKNRRKAPVIEYVPEALKKPSEEVSNGERVNTMDSSVKPRRKPSKRKEK